jgi:LPPG:FO 2-phospho-L-lactate transferase
MITVLSGGVGGAKLVDGLAAVMPDPAALTVIVNTADDWDLWGLRISPDVDTILYTLAGLASPERGWGIEGDTWGALAMMERYGFPTWFRVGDRDLATHLARTTWIREGRRLTEAVRGLAAGLGVAPRVLPMCDEPVGTVVHTPTGRLPFQEYFVARRAADPVQGIEFEGMGRARLTPEVTDAVRSARLIVVAPSNPVVSIGPILAVPGMRQALAASPALRLAVTPLVGGRAIKGPTVEMLQGLGIAPEPSAIATLYRDFLDVLVLDVQDRPAFQGLSGAGGADTGIGSGGRGPAPCRTPSVEWTDTIMSDIPARRRLARDVLRIARAHGAIPADETPAD